MSARGAPPARIPRAVASLLWCAIALLVPITITSSVVRTIAVIDPGAAIVELQRWILRSLNSDSAFLMQMARDMPRLDGRYLAHRTVTLLHVVPGALFLALAPFQFSARMRNNHIRFHRWSGRVLIVAAMISALTGLYPGVVIPFAGAGEASSIAVFGALILVALTQGFLAIRNGDVARHREWMIRAFAVAIGVSTIRVVGVAVQAVRPVSLESLMVSSFWIGWVITVGVAEIWIVRSRQIEGGGKPPHSEVTSTSSRRCRSVVRGTGSAFHSPRGRCRRAGGSTP